VVDEAGHAIEPEVIAVAATLWDYKTTSKKRTGQLILAGDPKQLGPVVSSNVCEKHGLALSYSTWSV
jgi:helicase MOV-10